MTVYSLITIGINILLYIFAKKILKLFNKDNDKLKNKVKYFRYFNILFFILQLSELYIGENNSYYNIISNLSWAIIYLYISVLLMNMSEYFSIHKFGHNGSGNHESMNSRFIKGLINIVIVLVLMITIAKLFGLDSKFGTEGLIGLFVAVLGFTHSTWLPDLYLGIHILNNKQFGVGDVLEIEGYKDRCLVSSTNYVFTTLRDIENNHISIIRNSVLFNKKIDIISKSAYIEGLREKLSYKIGYSVNLNLSEEDRTEKAMKDLNLIYNMFNDSYQDAINDETIAINSEVKPEILLKETGDFALHFDFYFYIKDIKKTLYTKEARASLRAKWDINKIVYLNSIKYGIDLSTPILYNKINEN